MSSKIAFRNISQMRFFIYRLKTLNCIDLVFKTYAERDTSEMSSQTVNQFNKIHNSNFMNNQGSSDLTNTSKNVNKTQTRNQQWKLKEFVQVEPESFEGAGSIPLQLLEYQAPVHDRNDTNGKSIWLLAGFCGPNKNDGHILALVQRAIASQTFENAVDVYLTPLVNPSARGKKPQSNFQDIDLNEAFGESSSGSQATEVKTLKRWVQQISPKAIVTFSNGQSMIRYLNTPLEIIQRLSEISEIPQYVFGTEPEEVLEDGNKIPRENFESSFGSHCISNNIAWIDFSVDKSKKNFEDLKTADWKPAIGPALKWLVEGFRFDPPKEEPKPVLPEVIPVLDIPPELANL